MLNPNEINVEGQTAITSVNVDNSAIDVIDSPQGEIGGEITGVDVKMLTPASEEIKIIREAIYRNKLVVIRNQPLNTKEYIAFTKLIGTPQVYFQPQYHHPDHPEIFVSTNISDNGKKVGVSGTGRYWHTDCSFEKHPLSLTSIRPVVLPNSVRGTYYMNMAKVYEALPSELREFADSAIAIHQGQLRYKVQACDIDRSLHELLEQIDREVPPVEHPAVITHPATGDKILYVNRGFTTKFKGLSFEENQEMLEAILSFSEQEKFVHLHRWEENDLIIWDNRYLNHMSVEIPPGELNKSYRIGIYDEYPFYQGIHQ
ncbi:TauD/TfdA dioxygenase family protein [Marinibactrum halimedae]|uniref:Dioxygenase n=1 Tax=Marinibactrum halimedae TaxID=1444977 RepID=A0AA37T4W8_9GAMM|nr:TauD/TfdA family dioxygenase [Marinibactrum halimedae]MCD9458746.1 TauD/TfdA family dioxygenase [Marinibactrum halimedae]GLS25303.1 putative dioxygenase [Marinibactrum halimedae]